MGKVLPCLSAREADFIASQRVFFVATSPLSSDGRVNVSPKAPGSSLVVLNLDPPKVAYADLTGSGAETAAHVRQNGRITVLFVNLERGPPKIVRLHGRGEVVPADGADEDLVRRFPPEITGSPGFRAIVVVDVERVSTSCGYSMPVMSFERYRSALDEFVQKKGQSGMNDYRVYKNSFSIDGLPSIASAFRTSDDPLVKPVYEDGYYFGQIVAAGQNGKGPRNQRKPSQLVRWETINSFIKMNPHLFAAATFVLGLLLGISFARI